MLTQGGFLGHVFWCFVAINGVALLGLIFSHLLRRRRKRLSTRLLTKHVVRIHAFPQRYQKLMRILLSARLFRVETLWQTLSDQEKADIRQTAIPMKLRRLTKKGSKWHRVRATLLLGMLEDKQSLGLLRQKALENDHDIAIAAVSALGRFNDENTARFLVSLLSSRYPINSSRVASIIEGIRIDLSAILLDTLKLGDPTSRFWAATLLGNYPRDTVRQALVHCLQDNNPNIRAAALDSLGKIGNFSTAMPLTLSLQDPVWFVRAHAALACGQNLLIQTLPTLIKLMADPVWWVRFDASQAISLLFKTEHAPKVQRELLDNIDTEDAFCRNMIAALLFNHGVINRLLEEINAENERKAKNARRLLAILYEAGGAPSLRNDPKWQQFINSSNRVLAHGRKLF